jgi:hypothetical protein
MGSNVKECIELCKSGEVPIENIALFIDDNINSVHAIFTELIRLNLFDIIDELLTWFHVRTHRFYASVLSLCTHIAKTTPIPALFLRLRKFLLADKTDLYDELDFIVSGNMKDLFIDLLNNVAELNIPAYLSRVCELALLYAASHGNIEMVRFIMLRTKKFMTTRFYNTYLCIAYKCPSMLEFVEKQGLKLVDGDFYGLCEDGNFSLMKRLYYDFQVYHPNALIAATHYGHREISQWLVTENFDERSAFVHAIETKNDTVIRWLATFNPRPVPGIRTVKYLRNYVTICEERRKEAAKYDARTISFDSSVFEACMACRLINIKARGLKVPIAAQLAAIVCKMIEEDSLEKTVKAMLTGRKLYGYIFDLWLPGESLETVIRDYGIDRLRYNDFARRVGSTERMYCEK